MNGFMDSFSKFVSWVKSSFTTPRLETVHVLVGPFVLEQ